VGSSSSSAWRSSWFGVGVDSSAAVAGGVGVLVAEFVGRGLIRAVAGGAGGSSLAALQGSDLPVRLDRHHAPRTPPPTPKGANQHRVVKGLHAKVYLTESGAAVGSANLSPNGLGKGTIEAAVVVRGSSAVRELRKWFEHLQQASRDVSKRLNDPEEFEKLLASGRAHQSGQKGGGKSTTEPKPSLFEAIRKDLPALKDVVFGWYTADGDLRKSDVKEAATRRAIPLPSKGSEWAWIESPFRSGQLERLNRTCRGRPLITWEVRLGDDEDEDIETRREGRQRAGRRDLRRDHQGVKP
jgi:hypothetical protein